VKGARTRAACDKAAFTPMPWGNEPPVRDSEPTFQLDKQVAHARREMGEDRWNELQREWQEGVEASRRERASRCIL
jgi:hypothetical protein